MSSEHSVNPTAASDALLDSLRATMGKMELALDSIGESIVWTDAAGRIEFLRHGPWREGHRQERRRDEDPFQSPTISRTRS